MGNRPWSHLLAALALLTVSCSAAAQLRPWSVTPSIGLRGTYTDNASLVAAPERGEFVTQISPGIRVDGRSARLTGSLNYQANLLFYARDRDQDRLANTLNASGTLEAIEDFFFVDAQGNVAQNYISPFGSRPADIFSLTDNRTETRTFSLSPYFRGRVLGDYSYELRNRNTWTSADTGGIANATTQQFTGALASPIRLFGWAIDGSATRTSYEDDIRAEQEERLVRARLFFQPDSTLRLSVSAGREENNYLLGRQEQSYDIYGYGVLWRPTPRTSAELNWEHRYFGSSRLVSLNHRTRLTAWNVSYSRNASNFQQELLRLPAGNTVLLLNEIFRARIPDPVQRVNAIVDFLRLTGTPLFLTNSVAFYSQQITLQENLQASMALVGVRNSITFTVFRTQTSALSQEFSTLPNEVFLAAGDRIDQTGFGVNASHLLTGNTSVSASAQTVFAKGETSTLETQNDLLGLSLNHTLSPRTTTFAGASYTRFVPTSGSTSHARSVFVGLDHRF